MAISYPLSVPTTIGLAQVEFTASNAVALSQSPFTYDSQVHAYPGQSWSVSVTLPALNRAFMEPWVAFLLSLRGQYGTFLMGDPNGKTPLGAGGGSPVVANHSDYTITFTGGPVSTTGYLLAGDYIQLGTGSGATLHKVLADVSTDASGDGSIDVWPAPRRTLTVGETIITSNAVGNFRLASNQSSWSITESCKYGISFDCIEAI